MPKPDAPDTKSTKTGSPPVVRSGSSSNLVFCVNGHVFNRVRGPCEICGATAEAPAEQPPPAPQQSRPPVTQPIAPPAAQPAPAPIITPSAAAPRELKVEPPPKPPGPLLVQCPHGHWFDSRVNSACPHCIQLQTRPRRRWAGVLAVFLLCATVVGTAAYLFLNLPVGSSATSSSPKTAITATSSTSSASVPKAPVVEAFDAVPANIENGQATKLIWSIRNASRISIDNGIGPVSGSEATVTPTTSTTYTIKATGAGGSATRQAVVTVQDHPASSTPVIDSFTADPDKITRGQTTTLHWSVQNAANLSIDHGLGKVTGDQITVRPGTTMTIALTATNEAGASVSRTLFVTVNEPSAPPPAPAPVIDNFSADPLRIQRGQTTVLRWSVQNAASLTLDNGIGSVTGNQIYIRPAATTTFRLTAANQDQPRAQASVQVIVDEPPPPTAYAAPDSGFLRCSGVSVPTYGRVYFGHLPNRRMRFYVDPPNSWQLFLSKQPDGSQMLTLVSLKVGIQTYCEVKWEVVK